MSIANQNAILQQMGITQWVLRDDSPEVEQADGTAAIEGEAVLPHAKVSTSGDRPKDTANDINKPRNEAGTLAQLRVEVSSCTQCDLANTRIQTVFGEGAENADWLFVGEAPGQQEDRQGQPFVGRAGQLLTKMLSALDQSRQAVYIANALKCRPPNNRDPLPSELTACAPYLNAQIKLLKPKVMVALGRFSAQSLLNSSGPLGKLRGKVYQYGDEKIPLIVTYHPAYLLRNPADKVKVWEDLLLAAEQVK